MNLNTFFQLCIYICIVVIVFTLAINFVNGIGVFEPVKSGVPTGTDTNNTFGGFLQGGSISGMDAMWGVVLTVGGLIAVAGAIAMHSAIPVGAYIFSGIFWTSYMNALGVLGSFFIPPEFQLIGTVMMFFFWCGAVAGMFSGSG